MNLGEVRNPYKAGPATREYEPPNSINVQIELSRTATSGIHHKDSTKQRGPPDVQIRSEVAKSFPTSLNKMACRNHFDTFPANFPFAHALY